MVDFAAVLFCVYYLKLQQRQHKITDGLFNFAEQQLKVLSF